MTVYYYQDFIFASAGFLLVGILLGYALQKQRYYLLVGLTLMLSTASLTDVIFRYNADPALLMLADSGNIFCALFGLTIFLHFSLADLLRWRHGRDFQNYLLLYLPALAIATAYTLTPLMVEGITSGAAGFEIQYGRGYWLVVAFAGAYLLLTVLLALFSVIESPKVRERERSAIMLLAAGLCAYYYTSVLILPFLLRLPNFASPLPLTCATIILVYAGIKYEYFSD
ncbi:MAG TPA: hypothetical protein VMT55_02365 [Candidatus Sulfotelmatobacter sp.]|nr:hypothetical protein [Candidatus Sulfotelmatobacter sp.]